MTLIFAKCNEVCLSRFISESFVLCKTYCPPPEYVPNMDKPVFCLPELSALHHPLFPFKACGTRTSYDSDTTYPLQVSRDRWITVMNNITATAVQTFTNIRLYF
jgi:hypothetical protein